MAANRKTERGLRESEPSYKRDREFLGKTPTLNRTYPTVRGYRVAEAEDPGLVDLLRVVNRYRLLFLAVVLLSLAATTLVALLMTPVYRAEVLLAPVGGDDDKSHLLSQLDRFGSMVGMAGITTTQNRDRNEAIATLKSRAFTERFIDDKKLLPILFEQLWDSENARWQVSDADKVPTLWDAYMLFDENVRSVREDRATGLVTLTIKWNDPYVTADWANSMVKHVNTMLRERAAAQSEETIRYLREQLKQISSLEMQQGLLHMIDAEMQEAILVNIDREFAFRVIDPAVVPEEAFMPVMSDMLMLGAIIGIGVGGLLVLVVNEVRNQQVQDA